MFVGLQEKLPFRMKIILFKWWNSFPIELNETNHFRNRISAFYYSPQSLLLGVQVSLEVCWDQKLFLRTSTRIKSGSRIYCLSRFCPQRPEWSVSTFDIIILREKMSKFWKCEVQIKIEIFDVEFEFKHGRFISCFTWIKKSRNIKYTKEVTTIYYFKNKKDWTPDIYSEHHYFDRS